MRDRAWRRSQKDRIYALVYGRARNRFDHWLIGYTIPYTVKTSPSENVRVIVRTSRQALEYFRHDALLSINTRKRCGCSHCTNPRKSGFGNSSKATSKYDKKRRCFDSYSFAEYEEYLPNSKWRSVRAKTLQRYFERDTDGSCSSF